MSGNLEHGTVDDASFRSVMATLIAHSNAPGTVDAWIVDAARAQLAELEPTAAAVLDAFDRIAERLERHAADLQAQLNAWTATL